MENQSILHIKEKSSMCQLVFWWKDGKHQALHMAGRDLTNSLKDAPHGVDVLKRFPVVGTLRKNKAKNVQI